MPQHGGNGHLVVTRRFGESIVIGEDIEVTVLPRGDSMTTVRVAIRAPRDVRILRGELVDRAPREAG
jgi:carbon storage regulator